MSLNKVVKSINIYLYSPYIGTYTRGRCETFAFFMRIYDVIIKSILLNHQH